VEEALGLHRAQLVKRIVPLILLLACGHHREGTASDGGGNGGDSGDNGDGSGGGSDGGGGDGGGDGHDGGTLALPDPCVGYTGIQHGSWPMAARCPSRAGQAAVAGPKTANASWYHAAAGRDGASVAIAQDGTIYVPDLNLHALSPSGVEKWFFPIGVRTGSPTIAADGTIYVGASDRHVYAIQPDGTAKWNVALDNSIYESPAIANDGTIYVCTFSSIFALNPDGTQRWSIDLGAQIRAPAIAADGTIYVANQGTLDAISPNGTGRFTYYVLGAVEGAPVVGTDGTVFITASTDTTPSLVALHPDGTLAWGKSLHGGEVYGTTAVAGDGTVLVTTSMGRLFAFTPAGVQKWAVQLSGLLGPPVISSDGIVYVTSSSGADFGEVDAVRLEDGGVVWSRAEGEGVSGDSAFAQNGKLLVGFDRVYTFDP
jgi:outer membrane protein assembly factor BamB